MFLLSNSAFPSLFSALPYPGSEWQGSLCNWTFYFLVIIYTSALLSLESGAVWFIWKPLPVHPFTSVGKQKHQENTNIKSYYSISTSCAFTECCSVCLDLISVCPQGRPISLDQCLQHFISSETIKEVECENCTKVHSLQYLCLAKFWSFVLLICNSLKTNHRQKTLLTNPVSRHIIIFIWWYFIPERRMGLFIKIYFDDFVSLKKKKKFFLLSFIKGPQ